MERTDTVTSWADSGPGDIFCGSLIVARRINRKGAAREVAKAAGGSVFIDGPRSWAVAVHDPESGTRRAREWRRVFIEARKAGQGTPGARILADIATHPSEEAAA